MIKNPALCTDANNPTKQPNKALRKQMWLILLFLSRINFIRIYAKRRPFIHTAGLWEPTFQKYFSIYLNQVFYLCFTLANREAMLSVFKLWLSSSHPSKITFAAQRTKVVEEFVYLSKNISSRATKKSRSAQPNKTHELTQEETVWYTQIQPVSSL